MRSIESTCCQSGSEQTATVIGPPADDFALDPVLGHDDKEDEIEIPRKPIRSYWLQDDSSFWNLLTTYSAADPRPYVQGLPIVLFFGV